MPLRRASRCRRFGSVASPPQAPTAQLRSPTTRHQRARNNHKIFHVSPSCRDLSRGTSSFNPMSFCRLGYANPEDRFTALVLPPLERRAWAVEIRRIAPAQSDRLHTALQCLIVLARRAVGSTVQPTAKDDVIEREALVFSASHRGRRRRPEAENQPHNLGVSHQWQKPAEHKKPRGVHRGLFEQNNPHADGERSKGVKDLPVTPRRSQLRRREAMRPALEQSSATRTTLDATLASPPSTGIDKTRRNRERFACARVV